MPSFSRDGDQGIRLPVDEPLLDCDKSGFVQLRKMSREIAVCQPRHSLKKDEVSAGAGRERGQDDQPGRLMYEPVQRVDILKARGQPPSAGVPATWSGSRGR